MAITQIIKTDTTAPTALIHASSVIPSSPASVTAFVNAAEGAFNSITVSTVPNINTVAIQLNTFATEANALAVEVNDNAVLAEDYAAEAAQSAIKAAAAVATLPDGIINDATITLTDTWSSSKINSLIGSIDVSPIITPTITAPTTGAIDFIGTATKSAFATSSSYAGILDFAHWQLSFTSDFANIELESIVGNLETWTPSVGLPLQLCYIRVKDGSDGHRSGWSPTVSFTTPNIFINTPTLTVTGTPTDVPETPTITTSAFSVYNGSDTHASTDWEVRKSSDNSLVWSSYASTSNKLTVNVPAGILQVSTAYTFKAKHNSLTYGSSAFASVAGTTKSAFAIPIGVAGALDFGVAPSSENFASLGLSEMTGTTISGHDNWGNYQHSDTSIVVHIPKFYYRVGNASAPQYATYGLNSLEIVGTETFATEAAANLAGYALHRAFIDGGAEKGGFFFDKYLASKKSGDTNKAVSVKNGNPIGLTTNATYTPSSTMTGCTGILADAVTLSRARGTGWNNVSVFMVGAIAMLSLAHAQMSSTVTNCAWYNATYNFPKGCNNGSRADVNDTSVTWTASPDTAAKGLTGSASTFAKSTHNGQNSGIADVNGLMYQVALGMTNAGANATDSVAIATNTLYVLKKTAYLKDLTAGWNAATDAWGNAGSLATRYDAVTSPITISSGVDSKWGNGANQVLSADVSGVAHDLCGFLPKNDAAADATGTNQFGNDYLYKYNLANMYVLSAGVWDDSAFAGSFYRVLNISRSSGYGNRSFRACAYA